VVSLHWILPVVGRCPNGHDPVMISDFRVQISTPFADNAGLVAV
jgi:hypothetical protein